MRELKNCEKGEVVVITCSYTEFLLAREQSPKSLPRVFLTKEIEDISCRTTAVVYFLLYDLAELPGVVEHTVNASHKTIAEQLKASPRTAARALTKLRDLGYIDINRQGSATMGYRSNKIKVRFPARLIKSILPETNFKLSDKGQFQINNKSIFCETNLSSPESVENESSDRNTKFGEVMGKLQLKHQLHRQEGKEAC